MEYTIFGDAKPEMQGHPISADGLLCGISLRDWFFRLQEGVFGCTILLLLLLVKELGPSCPFTGSVSTPHIQTSFTTRCGMSSRELVNRTRALRQPITFRMSCYGQKPDQSSSLNRLISSDNRRAQRA